MNLGEKAALSLALGGFVLLVPPLIRAQNSNGQADQTALTSAAARQEASQMVAANAHLVQALDARKLQPGRQFEAIIDGTVHLKDGTELPRGTVLHGEIAADQMRSGGTSHFALRFTEAKLKSGKILPVEVMIAGVAGPPAGIGYAAEDQGPPAWNGQELQVDEIGVLNHVDLHSRIAGRDSGVFVSAKKDDMKLAAGSRLSLAIAPQTNTARNAASGV